MTDRRLIEDSLPLAEISEQSAREKSLRIGNPSTLHIWWARRPLAACRAAVYAALCPAPATDTEREALHASVEKISNWNLHLQGSAQYADVQSIKRELVGQRERPRVLDPFAGGGTIPLAALDLGCDTYALDLNPVAHTIQLATLQFQQRFGGLTSTEVGQARAPKVQDEIFRGNEPLLAAAVRHWSDIVEQRALERVEKLYPTSNQGEQVISYIWARTIRCTSPACRAEVPLVRQLWLERKKRGPSTALKIVPNMQSQRVAFEIECAEVLSFDPRVGTVQKGNAVCPVCGQVTAAARLRELGQMGQIGERLLCVVTVRAGSSGKAFRLPTKTDLLALKEAARLAAELREQKLGSGVAVLPDEPLPPRGTLGFRVNNYGYTTWSELFNDRQLVTHATLCEVIRESHSEREREYARLGEHGADFAKAVTTYLGIMQARLANYGSRQCMWLAVDGTRTTHTFGRQALPMVWDYAESFPFNPMSANWQNAQRAVLEVLKLLPACNPCDVRRGSADRLPFMDAYFDAVVTDPPYYDAVPYSDLSDFFYVWHRRSFGFLYPEVYSTSLTPKRSEIVENPAHQKDATHFEQGMLRSFREIHRVLKPGGIAVVVFAHKSTSAWETLLNGLLESGLVVTASWPVETEKPGRLRAQNSAALASSVFIVCRKRLAHDDGFLDDVEPELRTRLHERLDYFWSQGIRGADFFMSAIGPAVEVFGRHKRVLKLSGEEVTIAELLDKVRGIVADYALQRIVQGEAAGKVDEASRFYLIWRWAYGTTEIESGEAIHMAQSMGVEFNELVAEKGVLNKKGDKVSLKGPLDRKKVKGLGEPAATGTLAPLIDVLHRAANLWAAGERQDLADFLATALPPGGADRMQRLAQSIVDVLPPGDKERGLYESFLVGARSLPAPTKKDDAAVKQQKLF